MTRITMCVLTAWAILATLVAALPHAGAASNLVAPTKISDTAYPSTIGP